MFKIVAFGIVVLSIGAVGQAQVFYEPAQTQYPVGPCGKTYYHAGRDAQVGEYVLREETRYSKANWTNGTLTGGNAVQRIPVSRTTAIYDDAYPYQDMSQKGWTAADAINRNNARIALYYRRIDSPPAGMPGVWIVPADGSAAAQVEPPRVEEPREVETIVPRGTIQIIPIQPAKPGSLPVASAARP